MALDQLLAALTREAESAAAAILAEARDDARRMLDDMETEIREARSAALGSLEVDLEAELQAALSVARLEARRTVLVARDRLLTRIFTTLDRIDATCVADPDYLAALPARLEAALGCFAADVSLRCRAAPALVDPIRQGHRLPAGTPIEADPGMATGFGLISVDGTVEVSDTIADRIAARRHELARRALAALGCA